MSVKNISKYFLVIILQLLFIASGFAGKITVIEALNPPGDVPFFDEEGNKKFLDQFEDKTILLVFWATWCAPCVNELPELDILQKDFRKLPFEIIAVSQDFQGVKIVQEYFKMQEIRHLKIYHDYQNQLFKAFSVVGLPSSFLIDQDGKIVVNFVGNINWHDDEMRKIILSHIPGNPIMPKNSYRTRSLNQTVKSKPQKEKAPSELPASAVNEHDPKTSDGISNQQPDKKLKEENNEPNK